MLLRDGSQKKKCDSVLQFSIQPMFTRPRINPSLNSREETVLVVNRLNNEAVEGDGLMLEVI